MLIPEFSGPGPEASKPVLTSSRLITNVRPARLLSQLFVPSVVTSCKIPRVPIDYSHPFVSHRQNRSFKIATEIVISEVILTVCNLTISARSRQIQERLSLVIRIQHHRKQSLLSSTKMERASEELVWARLRVD